jgi:hypothetical protein
VRGQGKNMHYSCTKKSGRTKTNFITIGFELKMGKTRNNLKFTGKSLKNISAM